MLIRCALSSPKLYMPHSSHSPVTIFILSNTSHFLTKMYNDSTPPSLKNKIKSSICCFRTPPHQLEALDYHECDYAKHSRSPRSPYGSPRSSLHEMEVKDMRRSLFYRISNPYKHRKRHSSSADYSYDTLSYSLNFEDERIRDDELCISFSSRLPMSPDRSSDAPMVANVSREIIACI